MATALMFVFYVYRILPFMILAKSRYGGRGQRIWQQTNVENPERTFKVFLLNADWFHFDSWQVVVSWQVMVKVPV
jgi:hypothetical protein